LSTVDRLLPLKELAGLGVACAHIWTLAEVSELLAGCGAPRAAITSSEEPARLWGQAAES
jgi:hypothetical protein